MPKKRRKYDGHRRLRNALRGAELVYDGNADRKLMYRMANGTPMPLSYKSVLLDGRWLWEAEVALIGKEEGDESPRILSSMEFNIEQSISTGDLDDIINAKHQELMDEITEIDSSVVFISQPWRVEVRG